MDKTNVRDAINVMSAMPFLCPVPHVLALFHKMYPETFATLPSSYNSVKKMPLLNP